MTEEGMDTAPGITDEESELAKALYSEMVPDHLRFMEWDDLTEESKAPWIDSAKRILAAMRAVASRTRPATPAPDAMAEAVNAQLINSKIVDKFFKAITCYRDPGDSDRQVWRYGLEQVAADIAERAARHTGEK